MSPNPPLYMLRKAPRFIPGLGTFTLLAVGGFVVGRSSVKDSNVSTTEPAQRTPWPPPLHDALDDAIRPYVRSRFQTREVSHRGRQSECTDRCWVTFSDPSGTATVYELRRLVRADGTNDCMRRIWLTTTNRHTEPLYLTRREVGLFNGPVQKFEVQACKKKDDDGRWKCEAKEFFEVHRRRILGKVVLEETRTMPPVGYVHERTPDGRAECPPKMPEGQDWWATTGRLMEERFPEGRGKEEEADGQDLLVGDEGRSSA